MAGKGDIRFTLEDAQVASDAWGFNCGPAALCAVAGMTPSGVRPHLQSFEQKGHTNPMLMASILNGLKIPFQRKYESPAAMCPESCGGTYLAEHLKTLDSKADIYPTFGLVRIQWAGPWIGQRVPVRARYRHTHWIAMRGREVFDVNAMCVGGWIPFEEWSTELVPWLLKECQPKANGDWWPTHSWEVRASALSGDRNATP